MRQLSLTLLLAVLLAMSAVHAQSTLVTFHVDMSEFQGSFETVNLNGDFNSWCGTCIEMHDDDGDGVYSTTLDIEQATIEYLFTTNGWDGVQESFSSGEPCTLTTGIYTNRYATVEGEIQDLGVVCFNSCVSCESSDGTTNTSMVTFRVDMNGVPVSENGLHVAGTFQGWDPSATALLDAEGDGIYLATIALPPGLHEFKFINGDSWVDVEQVPAACRVEILGNDNRFIYVPEGADSDLYDICYESCGPCGSYNVRLRVDLSGQANISPEGVHVAGDFQGWDPGATPLSNLFGGGVWERLISIDSTSFTPGSIIFKFINGNDWLGEIEQVEGDCSDGQLNRVLLLDDENIVLSGGGQPQLPPCFNACSGCVDPVEVTFEVDMASESQISLNGVHVVGSFQGWNPSSTLLSDENGDGVWQATVAILPGNYEFKFINGNDWAGEGNVSVEAVSGSCAVSSSNNNRSLTVGETPLIYSVCYNSCQACEGCLDENACNYDSGALIPDPASCNYPGCMDVTALNFDADAGCTGVCEYPEFTCNEIGELFWSTQPLGFYPEYQETVHGEMWSGEWVFNVPESMVEPGSGVLYDVHHADVISTSGVPDWMTLAELNWFEIPGNSQVCLPAMGMPEAPQFITVSLTAEVYISLFGQPLSIGEHTFDVGLNVLENPNPIFGCTYVLANNYVPYATEDDGNCEYWGCTEPTSANYNPYANVDDGSCGESCDASATNCQADTDGDGVVAVSDLLVLLGEFGVACE